MNDPAEGQYGRGRDFSNDPPIMWDGRSEVPDGWRCPAYEDRRHGRKPRPPLKKKQASWGSPGSWRDET